MSITNTSHAAEGYTFEFGIGKDSIVAGLRELATAVERGDVVMQTAVTYKKAQSCDYGTSAVVLKFTEKSAAKKDTSTVKELFGSHQFPVDSQIA